MSTKSSDLSGLQVWILRRARGERVTVTTLESECPISFAPSTIRSCTWRLIDVGLLSKTKRPLAVKTTDRGADLLDEGIEFYRAVLPD